MKSNTVLICLPALWICSLGAEVLQQEVHPVTAEEVASLDLTTAQRASSKFCRDVATIAISWPDSSKVGFRRAFVPEEAYSVRAGDSLEIVASRPESPLP